jgi:sugar/nucleoside kinase (ribokinase family)
MAALKHYDILVPGNYFCDLIFTGFPQFPALGTEVYSQGLTVTVGGVLNTVIALGRLGVNVGWLGRIGTDFFSRFALEMVEAAGVDTGLLSRSSQALQRVTVAVSYPHDRAFITYVDPAPSSVQMTLEVLESVEFRHLHFTGFQLDAETLELMGRVKARGATISMDCQDRPITLDSPGVRETLRCVDMFMPNKVEACKLTGCETIEVAQQQLRPLVKTLIIKDGAQGATLWQGETTLHAPAISVDPVDTTGAGDVFNAGFLTAYLEGKTLPECLRWGNICGGLSTLGLGGASTAPSREQVEALV